MKAEFSPATHAFKVACRDADGTREIEVAKLVNGDFKIAITTEWTDPKGTSKQYLEFTPVGWQLLNDAIDEARNNMAAWPVRS